MNDLVFFCLFEEEGVCLLGYPGHFPLLSIVFFLGKQTRGVGPWMNYDTGEKVREGKKYQNSEYLRIFCFFCLFVISFVLFICLFIFVCLGVRGNEACI